MALKQWDWTAFPNELAKAKHKERSIDHWRACFRCWFWLIGPGSTCGPIFEERGKHWDAVLEREVARRDLLRYGWHLSTVHDAHDFAVRNGPATVDPTCTIERDWPETYQQADSGSIREGLRQAAQGVRQDSLFAQAFEEKATSSTATAAPAEEWENPF